MRRLVAVVVAAAALVLAPAAFAHTTSLSGSSVCVNGAPVVTWVWVASDLAKDPRVVETSNTAIRIGSSPGGFTQLTTEAASATIKVRWSDGYTASTSATVPKPPPCAPVCPIPPPVVEVRYVDRVVEKIVEKPVDRVVEKVVTKTVKVPVTKWRDRTIIRWRTNTRIVYRYVPCTADKNWDSKTRTCKPKTPTG